MNPGNYRQELTEKIIRQLEAGTAPWQKPWNPDLALPGVPHNMVTGRPYHGGNHLWLSCQGEVDDRWCTYRQAQEKGWQVRKGEKSTTVEYWQWTENKKDENGKAVEVKLETPRVFYSSVFNASQMDNVPEYRPQALPWKPEEAAEQILRASGADIRYDKTNTAFYSPIHDTIHMPPQIMFQDSAGFYGTALHELGHWSGHASRLGRDLAHKFGSPEYAREELRAELASYFLASRLGIPHDPGQHSAYVGSWIDCLRHDKHAIFREAKEAERITEFVLAFQKEKVLEQGAEVPLAPVKFAQPSPSSEKPVQSVKPTKSMELEC
ncbi:MAG: zincin-like metallopeptidase domain-containing protein [Nitrosomonas ureae]